MKKFQKEFFYQKGINTKSAIPSVNLMEEVLSFIDETRDLFDESDLAIKYGISSERYFCCGGCGHFHTILKAQFPQAKCYGINGFNHILTEIDGLFYDVKGIFEINYWNQDSLVEVPVDHPAYKVVTNYAFSVEASGWFGKHPGPTNACFLQVLDEFSEKERQAAFKFFAKHRDSFFEREYNSYKSKQAYIDKNREDIKGVFLPFIPLEAQIA